MLTIKSVSGHAGLLYYAEQVAQGREAYYTDAVDAGEPPGRWMGSMAARLGLQGDVDPQTMYDLYERFVAPDGTPLGQAPAQYRTPEERLAEWVKEHPDATAEERAEQLRRFEAVSRNTVYAIDVTYGAAKSVTVAEMALRWAGRQAETTEQGEVYLDAARRIERAVWNGNARALRYLEQHLVARQGWHGPGRSGRFVPAREMVSASFLQHTNRDMEPHLHIHNVILNRVRRPDGTYGAIDTQSLRRLKPMVSELADLHVAVALRRAGVETRIPGGDEFGSEVVAVDREMREIFSGRTRKLQKYAEGLAEEFEKRYGRKPNAHELSSMRDFAAAKLRRAKTHDGETQAEMLERWADTARHELGAGLAPTAERLIQGMRSFRPGSHPAPMSPSAIVAPALAAVAEEHATWTRGDLGAQICRQLREQLEVTDDLTPEQIDALVDQLTDTALAEADVVQVAGRPLEAVEWETQYARPAEHRYALRGQLAAEDALIRAGIEYGRHAVPAEAVEEWLARNRPTVGPDQRAVLTGLASDGAALSVLVGPAGTGKSYTLGAFAEMWRDLSDGGRVHGLTVATTASHVLAHEGVDVTSNVAAWLAAQRRIAEGRATAADLLFVVQPRDVVVVDEASMVATDDLTRIREVVEAAGGRIVLTGDPRQLGPIEAGGAMAMLTDRAATYRLAEVRRFAEEWEGEASLRLRDGDERVLDEYDRRGRIRDCESLDDAVSRVADAAAADWLKGRTVLVTTGTNDLAGRIASEVRARLVEAGVVSGEGVHLGLDGGTAGVGDVVMARQNDPILGLYNRSTYTVTATRPDGSLEVVNREGELLVVPHTYAREHMQLAYASTVHAAQGATVDVGYAVPDGAAGAEDLYVMATRGRLTNAVYVSTGVEGADHDRPSGRAILADILQRSDEEAKAATTVLEEDDERLRSMVTLADRVEDATRWVCRQRLERYLDRLAAEGALTPQQRAEMGADQSIEHLSRLLRAVELGGSDPYATLRDALLERPLDGAESIPRVVASRIGSPAVEHKTDQAMPADLLPHEEARLARLHERVDARRDELGARVAEEQPDWAVRALGPVPEDPEAAVDWQRRAGLIAAHREATGWEDDTRPIPDAPSPFVTERRASWWAAYDALGRPEYGRAEAAMTEGQLRLRVQAWEREKTWAPAHADRAWKEAALAAADADIAATLADDEVTQKERQAERDAALEVVAVAEESAEAREAWWEETAATREAGRRAREELERRGIEIGKEDDRTPADEWLQAERTARAEDDAWRQILEDDVYDPERERALAEGVEERSGDLAMVERPTVEPGPEELSPQLDEAAITATRSRVAIARDILADRQSLYERVDEQGAYIDEAVEPEPAQEQADEFSYDLVR